MDDQERRYMEQIIRELKLLNNRLEVIEKTLGSSEKIEPIKLEELKQKIEPPINPRRGGDLSDWDSFKELREEKPIISGLKRWVKNL